VPIAAIAPLGNPSPLSMVQTTCLPIATKCFPAAADEHSHLYTCRLFPTEHALWGDHGNGNRLLYSLNASCAKAQDMRRHRVAFHPPHSLLFAATRAELEELPTVCVKSAEVVPSGQRVHGGVAQLAEASANTSHVLTCDPKKIPSHVCPILHTTQSAAPPLLTLEVHFTAVRDTRPSCLSSTTHPRPTICNIPQHHSFSTAAAEEWKPHLQSGLSSGSLSLSAHRGLLLAHVEAKDMLRASHLLSMQPLVASVAPHKVYFHHNLDSAAAIIQGGDSVAAAAQAERHPMWAAGLAGGGQIIGLGDSGVDMRHCAFSDPAVPFGDTFKTDEFQVPMFESTTHRKLALYYMCACPLHHAPACLPWRSFFICLSQRLVCQSGQQRNEMWTDHTTAVLCVVVSAGGQLLFTSVARQQTNTTAARPLKQHLHVLLDSTRRMGFVVQRGVQCADMSRTVQVC
jgi:hypothetical protein